MTEEKVIFIKKGTLEIGVTVVSGDRVDSVGNVWDGDGEWKSGPDEAQHDIEPLWPEFDDPVPENMGGDQSLNDLPKVPFSEHCPEWVPQELFAALIDGVADQLIDQGLIDPKETDLIGNELCDEVADALRGVLKAIRAYRLTVTKTEEAGLDPIISLQVGVPRDS